MGKQTAIHWSIEVLCLMCLCHATTIPQPPTMVKQPAPGQVFHLIRTPSEFQRPLVLDCAASGNPEPTYRWKKNGEELDYESHDKHISQEFGNGALVFRKPSSRDEGVYQCFAENIHGVSVSNAVLLKISEFSPSPNENPLEISAIEGQPLTMECNSPTGYPKSSIVWTIQPNKRTGASRSINSTRVTIDPDGNLQFSYVTRTDASDDVVYACGSKSVFGNDWIEYNYFSHFILKVVHPYLNPLAPAMNFSSVTMYKPPSNIIALLGKELRLTCIFGGNPVPEIVWRHNGSTPHSTGLMYENFGKTLLIKSVRLQDGGTYECFTSNAQMQKWPQKATVDVTVEAAPYWIKSPTNTDVAEGESVRFECIAGGVPEPNLEWFVNGEPIVDVAEVPWRKVNGNVLTIENSTAADTSVYQCNASNIHGYVFKDFYLNVLDHSMISTGQEAPLPVENESETPTVTLRCTVSGAPNPGVKLTEGKAELTECRIEMVEEDGLRTSDQEEYICHSSSKYSDLEKQGKQLVSSSTNHITGTKDSSEGSTTNNVCEEENNIQVSIKTPENFRLLNVKDAHSATFTWDPIGDPIEGYKIQVWKPDEGEEHLTEIIFPHNVTQSLVSIFQPHTRYFVRVRAFNDKYNGRPSETIDFMTPEGTPGPVATFEAYPMGPRALYLVWEEPMEPNGDLIGYTIHYQEVNGMDGGQILEPQPGIRHHLEKSYKLKGLKPSTSYRVTIRAKTNKGPGEPYYIETKTQDDSNMPPDKPWFKWDTFTDEDGKVDIIIYWQPTRDGRTGSDFFAQYRILGDYKWIRTPVEKDRDKLFIKGLNKHVVYEVQVGAVEGVHHTMSNIEYVGTSLRPK